MTCSPSTRSLTQVWDPTKVHYDCDTGLPITGDWRALTTIDLHPPGQFGFSVQPFTSGVTQVPAGVKAWSIGIISGTVYVNNVGPMPLGTSLNGGNYATNATLSAAITISGASGAYGLVLWEA